MRRDASVVRPSTGLSLLLAALLALALGAGAALGPGRRAVPSAGVASVRAAVLATDAVRSLSGADRAGRPGPARPDPPRAPGASSLGTWHVIDAPVHPGAVLPPAPHVPVPLLVLALLLLVMARFAAGSVPPFHGRGPPAGRSTPPT